MIFSSWFYLIIVTRRNSLSNCEHDPTCQKRSLSNLVKYFFVLHDEVLTGFQHIVLKQLPNVFYKKAVLKIFSNINRKTLALESLFNKFAGIQSDNFITKRLQHMCLPVNIAKFLKTCTLQDIC